MFIDFVMGVFDDGKNCKEPLAKASSRDIKPCSVEEETRLARAGNKRRVVGIEFHPELKRCCYPSESTRETRCCCVTHIKCHRFRCKERFPNGSRYAFSPKAPLRRMSSISTILAKH